MKRTLQLFLLITILHFCSFKSFAVCDFTVDKTTVCSGDVVTVVLAEPISIYHNIIVYKGTFPFGSVANSGDFSVVSPYSLSDNIVKLRFRGRATSQVYTIFLAEDNVNPNPQIPCSPKKVQITVNPSPDPEISNIDNFTICNAVGNTNVTISNTSTTKPNNTNYTIDWGDGSPVVNDPTFSTDLTHNYAPGNYKLTVTVTSNFPAPCNVATKDFYVKVGSISPTFAQIGTLDIRCAPFDFKINFNLPAMSVNPPFTSWKIYINGELDTTFTQATLPPTYTHRFEDGSCGFKSKDCSASDGDKFSFKIIGEIGNGLCAQYSSTNCFPVKDSIKPFILGKDTVCINESTQYVNGDPKSKTIFENNNTCITKPNRIWDVVPNVNFVQTPALNVITKNDLNITFSDTGHYRIKLKVFGDCNDKDTFKDIVVVQKVIARAAFVSPPCMSAAGFTDVPVSNFSTKPPSARGYVWSVTPALGTSFAAGNANSDSVTFRFTRSGSYKISLLVRGACRDETWDSTLVIKGKPAIDTLPIPEACSVPFTLLNPAQYFNYTNGGDPAATFDWAFGGGNPATSNIENPTNINYAGSGTFPVTLQIKAQCGDSTLTNVLKINNFPKPTIGPDRGACKFDPAFRINPALTGGVWRGRGITDSILGVFNPLAVPNGTYPVIFVLNPLGVCPTYDTVNISIFEIIGLVTGPDQTICKSTYPLQLTSDPKFPGGNWFGPGVINSVQGIFDPIGLAPGNYQIGYVFSDSSGACKDTAFKKVTVYDSIHVSKPPVLCAGQPYNFGNLVGNVLNGGWNFGDGTPNAIIPNPVHSYINANTYNAILFAESADRCRDTIPVTVKVIKNKPLKFLMSPDSTCTGLGVNFTFPAGHDTTNNYLWSFGVIPNINETAPNPHVVNFPVPILSDSNYIISLNAVYYCGTETYSDTLKVKAKPKANFSIQSVGCSPFSPTLQNTSFGSPTTFLWDFGNGQTTNLRDPIAPTYINTTRRDTTYTLRLTVSNSCGIDSIKKTIIVKSNNVKANFFINGPTQGCRPLSVSFFNTSTPLPPETELIWYFGDGTSAFANDVTHVYDTAGIFTVKLLVIGGCGRDSITTTVRVLPTPKPKFEVRNACVGVAAQFLNQTTDGLSYIWDFGDGSQSTAVIPTHIYTTTGAFDVKLIVANASPCVDSITKRIGVSVQPKASFNLVNPKVCEQEPVSLLSTSTNANNVIWYLGNGETSTLGSLSYIYPTSGTYTVTLAAINGDCRDSVSKPFAVEIYPKPIAEFLYDITPNKFNDPVVFTNITSNGLTYFWTFGDGDTSVEKDPIHQYTGEGPYRVTLYVVSDKGCKDTVNHPLGVDYSGQVYVPNVFAPEVGIGEAGIFKPKGLAMREYHIQIFSTYGQLLWESTALENNQPSEGWDGRLKGVILPQDIYVWKIRAIFTNGKAWEGMADPKTGKKSIMGSVLLLR
jgi:PKD repeat protein